MDVLVIGGGIVGASAALHLAEAGARVTLLEAEVVAAAASGRNAGSIQHPLDPVRAPLYHESVEIYRRHGVVDDAPHGLLAVGTTPAAAATARAAAGPFADLVPELLDDAALRALEPELAGGLVGCLLRTGYPAHPAAATRVLAAAAREHGAAIEEGVRAEPVVRGGRVQGVRTAAGVRGADAVLVAAGPWTSELLDPSGGRRPVTALWGVTVQVALPRPVRHRVEEWDEVGTAGELGVGVQFEATPLEDVTVLGATRTPEPPDEARLAAAIVDRARRFLPMVGDGRTVAVRACARPVVADGLPLLGAVPGVEGLHVAAGHGPYGISLGPASGRMVADAILGRAAIPDAFHPDRPTVAPTT